MPADAHNHLLTARNGKRGYRWIDEKGVIGCHPRLSTRPFLYLVGKVRDLRDSSRILTDISSLDER